MAIALASSVIGGIPVTIGVPLILGHPVVVAIVFDLPGGSLGFSIVLPVLTHVN